MHFIFVTAVNITIRSYSVGFSYPNRVRTHLMLLRKIEANTLIIRVSQ